jgi:hypothetical protein
MLYLFRSFKILDAIGTLYVFLFKINEQSFLLLGRNTVDKDGQNALPGVHVITRDSVGRKAVDEKTGKVLIKRRDDMNFC